MGERPSYFGLGRRFSGAFGGAVYLFGPRFTMHDIIVDACARSGFLPNVVAESSQIIFMSN